MAKLSPKDKVVSSSFWIKFSNFSGSDGGWLATPSTPPGSAPDPTQKIESVTSLRTLCDIMNAIESSKVLFSEVCQLLHIILTIPVTSATAERTFSAMRRLKTFLRSSMTHLHFNNVMLLHVHKEETDNIDLNYIANKFVAVNDRRKHFFGEISS